MTKIFTNELPDGSLRPILTGEQMAEIFAATRNRRPPMIQHANTNRRLPASIWTITDVIEPPTDLTGNRLFEIWIRRRDRPDVLVVYSKQGEPPVVGGLLERMTRPKGGVAAIWTDASATKQSMGGGYSEEALPEDWGTPAKKVAFGMTPKQKAMFGMPTIEEQRDARLERAREQLDATHRSLPPLTLETWIDEVEAIKKASQAGLVTASQAKAEVEVNRAAKIEQMGRSLALDGTEIGERIDVLRRAEQFKNGNYNVPPMPASKGMLSLDEARVFERSAPPIFPISDLYEEEIDRETETGKIVIKGDRS